MVNEEKFFQLELEEVGVKEEYLIDSIAISDILGLTEEEINRVDKVLESGKKLQIIWLQFQDCTGCSESILRSSKLSIEKIMLDFISLEYSEVLSATSGHHVEEALQEVIRKFPKEYVLCTEGSIPTNGIYCMVGGRPASEIYEQVAQNALAVVAFGSCSVWGGVAAANPNPTGAKPILEFDSGDTPVIQVPGCPPIPEVMVGVLAHLLVFGEAPKLDKFKRPVQFYKNSVHVNCERLEHFKNKCFVESFNDEDGLRKGYCLLKVGCKGPRTFSSCTDIKWNCGSSSPIDTGNPCIGCTENGFWDKPLYGTRLIKK